MKLYSMIIFTGLFYSYTLSQSVQEYIPRTKKTVLEFLKQLDEGGDTTVVFENIEFIESEKLLENLYYRIDHEKWDNSGYSVDCNVNLELKNCKFPKKINFHGCEFQSLVIDNCEFEGSFRIVRSKINNGLTFSSVSGGTFYLDSCRIDGSVKIGNSSYLHIKNCEFTIDEKSTNQLVHRQSSKWSRRDLRRGNWHLIGGQISFYNAEFGIVKIESCKFQNNFAKCNSLHKTIFSMDLKACNIAKLLIKNTELNGVRFWNSHVTERFALDKSSIKGYFIMSNMPFPGTNTSIPWSSIHKSNLATVTEFDLYTVYTASNDLQLANLEAYHDLMSKYKGFHKIYQERGERISANSCYVEMKILDTKQLRLQHSLNPSISGWFNWRFNQFLHSFCDYGTNPYKALSFSFCVVLFFASFYTAICILGKEAPIRYQDYMEKSSNKNSTFYLCLQYCFNRVNTRWDDDTQEERIIRKIKRCVARFLILVILVCVRFTDSLMLSINTFSTLGFGSIPVNGVLKYLVILEGFIGWLLLSIFSVTMVSQLIEG